MRVECKYNIGKQIPENFVGYVSLDKKIPLIIGKQYVVYALSEFYKNIWYCIYDEYCTSYPMWTPSQFFELTDNHLSRHWVFSLKKDSSTTDVAQEDLRLFFGFPEWATELGFYDRLTDGEEKEVALFKTYKELMDLEFPDSAISDRAQIGDSEWLICPDCLDAWNSPGDKDGMAICPKCKKMMHNPRYTAGI